MNQRELQQMKTGELAQQARKAGVKGVEDMDKEEMIQAMSSKPGAPKPGQAGKAHAPAPAGSKPQDWKNIPGNQS